MKTFKYTLLTKLIYRYANIPVTIIMVLYLIISIVGIVKEWMFVFPLLINLMLIYALNKFYFKMYKQFPFEIKIDNEKMQCSNFMINDRTVQLNLIEVEEIKGGIFSGRAYTPLYIIWQDKQIGISPHIKDFNKLLVIILTNIKTELYEELLDEIKKLAIPVKMKKEDKS